MVKVLIFDFDGTIADTLQIMLKAVNQLRKKYSYNAIKYYPEMRDKSVRQIIKEDLGLSLFQLPKYTKEMKELVKKDMVNVMVFPQVKQAINSLEGRATIGVVSSNSKEVVECVLKKAKIKGIAFVYSDSSLFGKHIVIKRLLKKYELNKEDVIYIGDEIRDIDASRKEGIKVAAVTWGFNSKDALKKRNPDFIIENPKEIKSLLKSNY